MPSFRLLSSNTLRIPLPETFHAAKVNVQFRHNLCWLWFGSKDLVMGELKLDLVGTSSTTGCTMVETSTLVLLLSTYTLASLLYLTPSLLEQLVGF